jgi:4-hydroxymandelate oxidase
MRVSWQDWEREATECLPLMVVDYYASGARDERTLRGNRDAWGEHRLRHRVLVDVSHRDPSTTVLGLPAAAPLLAAPTAFHGLAHPEAEAATARGVGACGLPMCLSTLSNTPVEQVVAASSGPVLFQLYVYRDRAATEAIIERVRAAGCRALVVTADAAILGTRERDVRNGFHLPPHLSLPNAAPGGSRLPEVSGNSGLAQYVSAQLDPSLSWDDVAWLKEVAGDLPLVLKGVVRSDDAARAVDAGADAIVVSNHGGRQLDAGVPTAYALPEVVQAVDGRCEVWVDGGIRRGTDILVAVALGARAVLVGRPVLWGLTVDGAEGVTAVLQGLIDELTEAMALCGAPTIDRITADLLWVR